MKRPDPIDEEYLFEDGLIVSSTDTKGIITYANRKFCEISGYDRKELKGKNHNIVRHPDMPKILFKILWDRIQNGHNFVAAIKNLAKDGRYYWVFTDFDILRNEAGEPIGYKASRKKISKHVTNILDPLYKRLVEEEKKGGMEASQAYLERFLKEHGEDITVDNMLENIHRFY